MSLVRTVQYVTPANYTFDGAKVEVTGGKAQLKDQRPTGATLGVAYTSVIDGNWGGGALLGTAVNGAAVAGARLDLKGGTAKYVDYAAAGNAAFANTGAIKFKLTPNYSGTPATWHAFFAISLAAGSLVNRIELRQSSSAGQLQLRMNDSDGTSIGTHTMAGWSPVAGTTYEFEINFDFDTGATRLFIDGVQHSTTFTGTGTRTGTSALLRVGNDYQAAEVANFEIEDLIVFGAVQHTANYTPGYSVSEAIYALDDPTVLTNSTVQASQLESFVSDEAAAGSDEVRWTPVVNGQAMYWNGSAWVNSDSSLAQANTAADINTNAADLDLSGGKSLHFQALLHSDDGTTFPSIESYTFNYAFLISAPIVPNECAVYGWVYDSRGEPVFEASVRIVNLAFHHGDYFVRAETKEVITDVNGYWSIDLIETASLGLGTPPYTPTISGTSFDPIDIPDQASASMASLV